MYDIITGIFSHAPCSAKINCLLFLTVSLANSVFLLGAVLPPRGHLETFLFLTAEAGFATGIWWVEVRDAVVHPVRHRTAKGPNVSSAEVGKLKVAGILLFSFAKLFPCLIVLDFDKVRLY